LNAYNATYNAKDACPETSFSETNAVCLDPQLTDETWHLYGYGNMTPVSGSRVIGAGTTISGVTTDYTGATRPSPPSMGSLQLGSTGTGGSQFSGGMVISGKTIQ
jgi:outer membrane usher protein FimD/PapC